MIVAKIEYFTWNEFMFPLTLTQYLFKIHIQRTFLFFTLLTSENSTSLNHTSHLSARYNENAFMNVMLIYIEFKKKN